MTQNKSQSRLMEEGNFGKSLKRLVGAIGFEPATPCAQGRTHTTYQSLSHCVAHEFIGISRTDGFVLRPILRPTFRILFLIGGYYCQGYYTSEPLQPSPDYSKDSRVPITFRSLTYQENHDNRPLK